MLICVLAFLTECVIRNGSDDEPAPAVAAVPVEEPQAEEMKPSKRGKKASKPDAVSTKLCMRSFKEILCFFLCS